MGNWNYNPYKWSNFTLLTTGFWAHLVGSVTPQLCFLKNRSWTKHIIMALLRVYEPLVSHHFLPIIFPHNLFFYIKHRIWTKHIRSQLARHNNSKKSSLSAACAPEGCCWLAFCHPTVTWKKQCTRGFVLWCGKKWGANTETSCAFPSKVWEEKNWILRFSEAKSVMIYLISAVQWTMFS